jgi:hypothetical protein
MCLINTNTLLEARKDVGLDINANENEYTCVLVLLPKTGQNCHMMVAKRSFENMANLKKLGMKLKIKIIFT